VVAVVVVVVAAQCLPYRPAAIDAIYNGRTERRQHPPTLTMILAARLRRAAGLINPGARVVLGTLHSQMATDLGGDAAALGAASHLGLGRLHRRSHGLPSR
jgi:hypothetical protein